MARSHGAWRSLVAHPAGGRKVAGSNPVAPIKKALQMTSSQRFGRGRRGPIRVQVLFRIIRAADPSMKPNRAAVRWEQLGPQIVQMPEHRAVELDAVTHQPLAVVDQQPQVALGPGQVRGREAVQAFPQRGASDVERASIASDLPRRRALRRAFAVKCVGIRKTHSPRSIRKRSSDPETCRQSSTAQTRSPSRPRAHCSRAPHPRRPTGTVCSPSSSPVAAAIAAIVSERL